MRQQLFSKVWKAPQALFLTHLPGALLSLQDTQLNASAGFLLKEQMLCLCEGGKGCSRENPSKQKVGNAIKGLHSNWVGEKVLAMARPWQDNISKHKLLEQFKEHNIGLIVNLQEVGDSSRHGTVGTAAGAAGA
jgi:protein tyrosine phosphatase domain-containing protein 1